MTGKPYQRIERVAAALKACAEKWKGAEHIPSYWDEMAIAAIKASLGK